MKLFAYQTLTESKSGNEKMQSANGSWNCNWQKSVQIPWWDQPKHKNSRHRQRPDNARTTANSKARSQSATGHDSNLKKLRWCQHTKVQIFGPHSNEFCLLSRANWCWTFLNCASNCWNMLGHVGICWDMLEHVGTCCDQWGLPALIHRMVPHVLLHRQLRSWTANAGTCDAEARVEFLTEKSCREAIQCSGAPREPVINGQGWFRDYSFCMLVAVDFHNTQSLLGLYAKTIAITITHPTIITCL